MFHGCKNLEYINLKNFDGTQLDNNYNCYRDVFTDVPDNIVILTNNNINILGNFVIPQLDNINCHTKMNNYNNWKSKQQKIIYINGNCIDKCSKDSIYQYEYNGKCYDNCTNGFIIDETNEKICKCELDKCLHFPTVALQLGLCTECNENYYKKENDETNMGEYINCYKIEEGYYLDLNDSLIKKCYKSCHICETKGDNFTHNCQKCNTNYTIEINYNNYLNWYENCSYYHYYDKNNLYHCTNNFSCPEDYPYLIKRKFECSKNVDIIGIIEELGKNDTVLIYIEKYLTSEYYDTSFLDQGEEEIFDVEEIKYTITTTESQEKFINKTSINLGECQSLLRDSYNLNNKTIYLKKIEINEKGMKIPKIEYDFYSKLNGSKLEKLELIQCQNKITFSIPVEISGNLDELISTSDYYNDICYSTTSEDGTDIILKDRQKEFVDKNKTLCQEDCNFVKYEEETKNAKCSCDIKKSSLSFSDMKINKTKLFQSFVNIESLLNINILKCYKQLKNKKNLLKNIGSW